MRVLLDENIPFDLAAELPGHDVVTVQGLGRAGLRNGELLQRASGGWDAFLTLDSNLEYQQQLSRLPADPAFVPPEQGGHYEEKQPARPRSSPV